MVKGGYEGRLLPLSCCRASLGRLRSDKHVGSNNDGKWMAVDVLPAGVILPPSIFPHLLVLVAPRAFLPLHPSSVPTRPLLLHLSLVLPEDTNNTIVGLLLNRPNYTLTGLAPTPSPDAKTRMFRVWVSGWDFTPPEGP